MVIGAGVAGLACAATLTRFGADVKVFEAADDVGGRVRTDVVDGFRCDRGFQLLNPAYPAVRELLSPKGLRLRQFHSGVAVRTESGLRELYDPRAFPTKAFGALRSDLMTAKDLAALAKWLRRPASPVSGVPDVTLAQSFDDAGLTGPLRTSVLDPFLSGVIGDATGSQSANYVRYLVGFFMRGTPGVPKLGMGEIPRQFARQLGARVKTRHPVEALEETGDGVIVRVHGKTVKARAAVIATDARSAAVLSGQASVPMKGLATWWFAVDDAPFTKKLLLIDGRGSAKRPVANTAVMSNVSSAYAPKGQSLVQATQVLGGAPNKCKPAPVSDVRRQLSEIYNVDASSWQVVTHHEIRDALPEQSPPWRPTEATKVGGNMWWCGDHLTSGSLQGAMESGASTAKDAAAALGYTVPTPKA